MKSYYALDVPQHSSAQVCSAITQAFVTNGFGNCACIETLPSEKISGVIQYLDTPIEPVESVTRIYLRLQSSENPELLLSRTLLDESFISKVAGAIDRANLFSLEILVTAFVARDITLAYTRSANAPKALFRVANRVAADKASWIERILCTPDLGALMEQYADKLIAIGPTPHAR